MQEKVRVQHTSLVLRLIPTSITPHILWLLMLLSTTTTEHLIEEAELRTRAPNKRCEDRENNLEARHIRSSISSVCDKRRVTCVKRKSKWMMCRFPQCNQCKRAKQAAKRVRESGRGGWCLGTNHGKLGGPQKTPPAGTGISSSALSRHPYATTLPTEHHLSHSLSRTLIFYCKS